MQATLYHTQGCGYFLHHSFSAKIQHLFDFPTKKEKNTFNMDAKNIQKLVEKAKNDILQEVNDRLPRKVGVIAVNHFKQNFRDSGWLDDAIIMIFIFFLSLSLLLY